MIGAGLSPEGVKKVRKMMKEGPAGAITTGQKEEGEKSKTKMIRTTCWKCMRAFPYEEGETPVCPYCGTAQKVQCPQCEEVFTPKNKDNIVCPKCGAELQRREPETKEQEKPPPEVESPAVTVGGGLLE